MCSQKPSPCRTGRNLDVLILCAVLLLCTSPGFAEDVQNEDSPPALSDEALLALVTPEYIKETQAIFFDFDSPLPVEMINNCVEAWDIKTFEEYRNYFRENGQTDEYWVAVGAKGLYAFDNTKYMSLKLRAFAENVSREKFIEDVINENIENFFVMIRNVLFPI